MDYEKKYKEAIELMKDCIPDADGLVHVRPQEIFPELKESEDERIREEIISALKYANHKGVYDKHLAWLEKQGAKVSAIEGFETEFERQVSGLIASAINKEHEYNQGYVKWTANALLNYAKHELEKQGGQEPVDKIKPKFHESDWVILTAGELSTTLQIVKVDTNKKLYWFNDSSYLPIVDEECLHLWSIQDAKDGDVLCTYECDEPKIVFILKGAPKKPYVLGYHCYYNIMYPHFDFDSEKGCLAPNVEDVKPATKEQRDLLFQKMKKAGYEWDADNKELKKLKKQDEELSEFESVLFSAFSDGWQQYLRGEELDIAQWAKEHSAEILEAATAESAAWSEEDERMYRGLHNLIYSTPYCDSRKAVSDWLESLKERYTWKPSDEHIHWLKWVVNRLPDTEKANEAEAVLKDLLEQLKKL